MAIIRSGQIGEFNGGIDNLVISPWNGLLVGRRKPSKSSKPATLTQLEQRAIFGLVTSMMGKIGETLLLGYRTNGQNLTPYNAAAKYHIANAVTGSYPDYALDYSKIKLSNGVGRVLDSATGLAKTVAANNRTTITWEALEATRPDTLPTDQLRVVLYNATADFCMVHPAAGARSALTATVRIPVEEENDVIHAWVLFVSADQKLVSRSSYLGIVAD